MFLIRNDGGFKFQSKIHLCLCTASLLMYDCRNKSVNFTSKNKTKQAQANKSTLLAKYQYVVDYYGGKC